MNKIIYGFIISNLLFSNNVIKTEKKIFDDAMIHLNHIQSNDKISDVKLEYIHYLGNEYPGFIIFENQDKALKDFKNKYDESLKRIQVEFDLEELSNDNYIEYYDVMKTQPTEFLDFNIVNDFLIFFDLYENKEMNEKAQEIASEMMIKSNDIDVYELSMFLPEYSGINDDESMILEDRSLALPDLQSAISYAIKYAVYPNSQYRYWDGADCTNFVSQILFAGGVKQVVYSSEASGWWYNHSGKQSISWINADTFSRYWGRRRYNNFSMLAAASYPGTFIAADWAGDGKVDHCAFVTAKDGFRLGIAQHSKNYHSWSDQNNWSKLESTTWLYMVR